MTPVTAYTVVFLASASTLVLEIVAGRILAPFIGVSLYTWTSIIGVVLSGISAGNYLGGVLADRGGSRRVLGLILVGGGLTSFAILPLATPGLTTLVPATYPGVLRIVLLTALLFLAPSLLLGMVSPLVVKLTLADLGRTGRVVGRIYAWSTLGSIVGTFLTGFLLISAFGTRRIVFGVGLLLVGLGVAAGARPLRRQGRLSSRKPEIAEGLLLLLVLLQIHLRDGLQSGCYRETDYYCVKVHAERLSDGRLIRALELDHLIHGYNSLQDPTYLHYGYLRTAAALVDRLGTRTPRLHALFLGGGAYTFPRYLEAVYPDAVIEVSEIDPAVTRTNFEMMGLDRHTRIVTYNADARQVIERMLTGRTYDLVFGDAFNDLQVPYHLTTAEFAREIRNLLHRDGIYLALVVDRMWGGRFLASYVRTLRAVFSHVYVLKDLVQARRPTAQTFLVAASLAPIDLTILRFAAVASAGARAGAPVPVVPEDLLRQWLDGAAPVLLTDDYAPADNLLAPIFLERGF
jgi:MFS family permease